MLYEIFNNMRNIKTSRVRVSVNSVLSLSFYLMNVKLMFLLLVQIGGRPVAGDAANGKANYNLWQKDVEERPLPVLYDLQPIFKLV